MRVTLLGPQHPTPNLGDALDGVEGPVALINAGWRHGEDDLSDFGGFVDREIIHVPLYSWFRQHNAENVDFATTYEARQQRIRQLKDLYRVRMNAAMQAVHDLQRRVDGPLPADLVAQELARAVDAVRQVDEEMIASTEEIRDAFSQIAEPWKIDAVRSRHDEAAKLLDDAGAICIAGGNVAVLRNRMNFFGLRTLLEQREADGARLIAWSAGAMALCERIVLYYDDPPEGPSEAEVLGPGLGLLKGLVLFPHAARRLRLDSTSRVARMARRVAPSTCISMENGAHIEYVDGYWLDHSASGTASVFSIEGTLGPVEVA
jgi:peptidase E